MGSARPHSHLGWTCEGNSQCQICWPHKSRAAGEGGGRPLEFIMWPSHHAVVKRPSEFGNDCVPVRPMCWALLCAAPCLVVMAHISVVYSLISNYRPTVQCSGSQHAVDMKPTTTWTPGSDLGFLRDAAPTTTDGRVNTAALSALWCKCASAGHSTSSISDSAKTSCDTHP